MLRHITHKVQTLKTCRSLNQFNVFADISPPHCDITANHFATTSNHFFPSLPFLNCRVCCVSVKCVVRSVFGALQQHRGVHVFPLIKLTRELNT